MKIENGILKITQSKRDVERAMETLLQERMNIRKSINNMGGCYRKEDCQIRLELINKDEIIGDILYRIFDIQDHEFMDIKNDYNINIEID